MAIFDRTFLPPKSCEFVVLSDTHYLLHPELQGGEWESIRAFPARAERALRLAGALQADFCAHLGDVTHEYPETGRVGESRAGAQAQFARHGLRPYVAPGNMDIGDKPDPTSPAEWVTPETLADWQAAFGPSWFSFDQGEIHGVVLNSVIMNGPLPEAEAQARWLEADLAAHHGQRIILFMHLPPFFVDEGERAFGMYNSLDDPARGWLLDLIRHHAVEAVFAGHTHFVGLNRVGATRLFIAPSTTTSRAGLPEAFTVCPPDRGRSDVDKLGFYFVRVDDRGLSVHLIRTGRETAALDDANPRQVLLTCPSRDLPHSPLGVVATHPLGHLTPGPIIWPSVVRQRVRDDWRLFACLELGARHVRIPESDLDDPMERDRLPVLRGEGVSVIASWLWSPRADLTRLAGAAILGDPARAAAPRDLLDEVEVVVPGDPLPDPACLAQIRQVRKRLEGQKGREHGLPVTLSTALRTAPAGPRYHGRTRVGYRPDELPALDEWLGRHDAAVDHVVCRVYADDPPWAVMQQVRTLGPLRHL
ncbi:MAG: metallophosphoesterase family protein, partial [Chloroflexota bacterium]